MKYAIPAALALSLVAAGAAQAQTATSGAGTTTTTNSVGTGTSATNGSSAGTTATPMGNRSANTVPGGNPNINTSINGNPNANAGPGNTALGTRGTNTPTTAHNDAVNTSPQTNPRAPVAGANSFTEGQARSRIQDKGFSQVTGLKKDDKGIWRGTAMKDGKQTSVALDYQGNVVAR